jgi:hypothetical protein
MVVRKNLFNSNKIEQNQSSENKTRMTAITIDLENVDQMSHETKLIQF